VFVSKKRWDLIVTDIFGLQEDVFLLELALSHHKKLHDVDNKAEAMKRHPASPKKTTTKKVDKNGK
jgi:hypothetical protein